MRNIPAERSIERKLAARFDVDTSKVDVTVLDGEATISGVFLFRTRQLPMKEMQIEDVKRYFAGGRIEGVDRFYFNLGREAHY